MSGVLLGKEKGTGKEIYLSSEARRLGNYMVGLQGMGKTNLLLQIALQDLENGDGLCVLSPHSDLIKDLLKRIPDSRKDDVIVFDPASDYPVGINLFEWDGETPLDEMVDRVASQIVGIFKQLWEETSWGPQLEETMTITAQTLVWSQTLPPEKRPTMREFVSVLNSKKHHPYREFLLDHIRQTHSSSVLEGVFEFWQMFDDLTRDADRTAYVGSTKNKVRFFRDNKFLAHIFGQSKTAIDLGQIMAEGKILLVDLDVKKLGEGNVGMFGSLLAGRLFISGLTREAKGENTKSFHVIADEFAYFAMSEFEKLQDQLRKFDVTVLLAHQRRGQLNDTMKDATKTARNWVVLNVNPDDARELSGGFDSTPREMNSGAKQQDFGLSSQPWDDLKRQAHENDDVVKLAHVIQELAFSGAIWRPSNQEIEDFFQLTGDLITSKQHDYYRKLLLGFEDSLDKNYPFVASNNSHRANLLMNKYLYLRMTGQDEQSQKVMEDLMPEVFPQPDYTWFPEDDRELWSNQPNISFHVTPQEAFAQILPLIVEKTRKKFIQVGDGIKVKWLSLYSRYYKRLTLRLHAFNLGTLLAEQPVYVRGGAPVEPEGAQRTHSDVTEEWKNRFAHLPQYEAWVKVQEEGAISEYHIETKEIDSAIRSDKEADELRAQSSQKYGISRDEIENQINRRTSLDEDNQLDEYEDLGDDEPNENLDNED